MVFEFPLRLELNSRPLDDSTHSTQLFAALRTSAENCIFNPVQKSQSEREWVRREGKAGSDKSEHALTSLPASHFCYKFPLGRAEHDTALIIE